MARKRKFVLVDKRTGKAVSAKTFARAKSNRKNYERIAATAKSIKATRKSIRQTEKSINARRKEIEAIDRRIARLKERKRKISRSLRETKREALARERAARKRANALIHIWRKLQRAKKAAPGGRPIAPAPVTEFLVTFTYTESGRSFDVITAAPDADAALENAKEFLSKDKNGKKITAARFHGWAMRTARGNVADENSKTEYRANSRNS
jgi:hypothetical protein